MTTPLWTSAELEKVLKAKAGARFDVAGVSIDSRSVGEGDLFVALAGPSHDGHAFVADAFAAGAAAALVHADGAYPGPTIRVEDTLAALSTLGAAGRTRAARTKVVGVTGSVGKTGTKEMLGAILADQGATHISRGSHNNHWGVPLTLARLPRDSVYAVQEMGMNHTGELAALTRIARPDVAVITTVGPAHLEHFGDLAAIVAAKCEIFEGLTSGGTAVLPADHAFFGTMESAAKAAGAANVITFGAAESADLRLLSARVVALETRVEAEIGGQAVEFSLPFIGRHWAMNSLAALGAAIAAGADPARAIETLSAIRVPDGRGAITEVATDGGAFVLLDESYNANPQSLEAAIDALAAIANVRQMYGTGRAIAVLGDMFELGPTARALHRQVAQQLAAREVDRLFACGELMRSAYDAAPDAMRAAFADDAAALVAPLAAEIRPGDIVMIKGSHGMRMDRIVAALKARP
ncbi:putative UDP-N-acetylmuramoyl-tripeptide--D-alanyl-D-alanine ligase [uncultured Alphaproteobacteria bacterium]|uniref:UDP-N-acetylmuramoyl-tripeptide--D-alanyl-D-alanine ligase n=1 Tax=uncultured Alphaproteobacteria bacterium TaxID=91750 RepID=A0A212JK79_9PROT|nr:putative UDP-N-acetylmuramoyl-tripeptide--D-alanyl-D-alanine ligase [uncultured Alphaproteobacteria bacterium]